MPEISDKWILAIYLVLLALAEITTSYFTPEAGILFHIVILFILFIHYGYLISKKMSINMVQWLFIGERKRPSRFVQQLIDEKKNLSSMLLAIMLAPTIRIMSLVMPLSNFPRIQWFTIIGIAVYLSFIFLIIQQKISIKECGIRLPQAKHIPLEIGIILLAVPAGFAEYYILQPDLFISSYSIGSIISIVIILFITTGLMEELIFRGLLQKKAVKTIGLWPGILFVSILFAVLHIGNLSLLDVLLVFSLGLLYALVVNKTKTIIGVSISHTVVNIILFVVCPLTMN